MQTLETYLKEVRDLHKQAVQMFKDVKENHLAHIEPDIQSLKKDISALKTDVSEIKDILRNVQSSLAK